MNSRPTDKNRRVLVIDDNRAIHEDFRKILCPAIIASTATLEATESALFGTLPDHVASARFEVDSAYQGQQGLQLVQQALAAGKPYAMAFVDVRMPPGWDGVETTRKLWEIDPSLQIVICTAYSDYSWGEMFQQLGQSDGLLILKKPFDAVEALQLAHALTEKWWLRQQSHLEMAQLGGRVAERTQQLQQKTALLEAQMHSTLDGILVVDREGRKTLQNQRVVDLFKIPPDIAHGNDDAAQVRWVANAVRDPAQFGERVAYLYAHPDEIGREEIELKDGRILDQYSAPVIGQDGQYHGRIWTFRDITERRQAEKALQESERRFSDMLHNLELVSVMLDQDARITYCNDFLLELTGWRREEVLGRDWFKVFLPPEVIDELQGVHSAALADRPFALHYENEIVTRSGVRRLIHWNNSVLRSPSGDVIGSASIGEDITERKQAEQVLRQRVRLQEQLANIAATVPGMIYSLRLRPDGSTQMPFASGVLSDIFDLQPQDVIEDASALFALIHPEDIGHVQATIAESARTLTPWRDDFRVCRTRLGEIWIEGHSVPQREPDGSVLWHGFVQNITERKRAEDALRTSAAEFRGLAEAMPQMVWITRPDGWNIYFSQQWMDYTGLTLEESLGHGWVKPFHPDDQQGAREAWQQATATIGVYSIEARLRRADGTYRWWLVRGVPHRDSSGNIRKWFGTCTDIHDLKLAGDALQESKRFLQSTLDALSSHIAILDEHGTIVEVNSAWDRFARENSFMGGHRGVGDNYLTICDSASGSFSQEAPAVARGIRAIMTGQSDEFHLEYPCHGPQEERWFVVRITRFGGDGPVRVVVAHENITDRKRIEAQLFQSQKMETVGKLAGGVAHEFNSLLTTIIGQSELLLGDLPAGSPLADNVTEVRKAADRAATLTRQLLAYGRRQFLQLKVLNLNQVVASMDAVLRHLMGGDDVAVKFVAGPGPHLVKADVGQIEQVILNLAMNARDAMPNGGKLTLETALITFEQDSVGRNVELTPGNYVMLAISDTGRGMSEAVKARAFEPFFTTKGVGQGTGLGLSTCHGIIKQSGGHISVYSEPGRGTIFKIYLPQVDSPEPDPVQRLDSPDLPRGSETILLVEDDPALRDMAAMLLKRLGYTVVAAANGVEALSLTHERDTGHIDLLFTDLVMPHIGGKELAERVRSLYPHMRILFTSAYTEQAIAHQGASLPGVALLQKPFTPSALAKRVRAVLDQPIGPGADPAQGTLDLGGSGR